MNQMETGPRPLTRIMHVDDEPDILEVAKLALEEVGGYTVESCGSGAEALARAPEFHPDMILLDVMMPGMSGPDALKALRNLPETAKTPIVFMTAKVRARDIQALRQCDTLDIIEKPFDPMTVSELVDKIWRDRGTPR